MLSLTSVFFFLMIRRPPRSTLSSSSAASDVYKRQQIHNYNTISKSNKQSSSFPHIIVHPLLSAFDLALVLSLIHISEPTRLLSISYAVFCLKKKKKNKKKANYKSIARQTLIKIS
eukprot:TRINITY_DN21801_c0_g1_i2.p1 TRINITY_DN21801_c0_g1~~TRINITY_DN21801_c0_g1_i2.p1  ORF type:complete len:116 (-),score=24.89 TRINITY_DN21801_c0_g1_i2:55-402(-)